MADSADAVTVDGVDGGSSSVGSPVVSWPSGALAVVGIPQSVLPGVGSFPVGMDIPIGGSSEESPDHDGDEDTGYGIDDEAHRENSPGVGRDDGQRHDDGYLTLTGWGADADGDGNSDDDFPDDDDDELMFGRVGVDEEELEEEQEELRLRGRSPRGLALRMDLGLAGDDDVADLVPDGTLDDDESEGIPRPVRMVFHRPSRFLRQEEHPVVPDDTPLAGIADSEDLDADAVVPVVVDSDDGERDSAEPVPALSPVPVPVRTDDVEQPTDRRLHAVMMAQDGSFVGVPDALATAADAVRGLVGAGSAVGRPVDVLVYDGTDSVFVVIRGDVSTYVESTADGLVAAYRPGMGAWAVDTRDVSSVLFAG